MTASPTIEYRIGDVFDRLAEIPDASIDLIVSSPPFLALRSYLPDDHPDKSKEIGQEPTPAEFISTHLALAAEYSRVLAPHGSLCYEIGDTFSSQGGVTDKRAKSRGGNELAPRGPRPGGDGYPLAKSMCLIPHMFTGSLAYGRNLLTGETSPAGEWRIRNVICWARPNPPVGALGDKFRPATSYITVACKGKSRYFDLDAVRTVPIDHVPRKSTTQRDAPGQSLQRFNKLDELGNRIQSNPAGAPPLDWHADDHPEDGDWLWKLCTAPYKGAHFATFPMTLPKRLIEAMCPHKVCTECGQPSERIVERDESAMAEVSRSVNADSGGRSAKNGRLSPQETSGVHVDRTINVTTGWTDCGHDSWRPGVVLDPFGGSGTTGEAAQTLGRSAILIDIDERNADLARDRVGMFLEVSA